MSSRKRTTLIMLIVAIVLGIAIIISGILLIIKKVGGIKEIKINATFSDMELDVNSEYEIAITTDPESANPAKFEYIADSSAVVFEHKEDNKAVVRTLGPGAVTIKVKYKGVESNSINLTIVDKAAKAQQEAEAQAAAEAEALAQAEAEAQAAEAEAAAQAVTYVKVTKDSVNVRSQANTDCDVVGKASKGDTFEVVAVEGEWTQVKFSGDTLGYIRNDMIETVADDAAAGADASADAAQPAEEKKEEATNTDDQKKAEEAKKEEEAKKAEEEAKKADEAAKKAEEDAKKAAEDAQKAAEAAAAQQAAAAAAAPAASGKLPASGPWVYQGVTFSAAQVAHFHALWDYTGDAAEMVTHHSAAELVTVCQVDGIN